VKGKCDAGEEGARKVYYYLSLYSAIPLREAHGELAPFAERAIDRTDAAVILDDRLHKVQAQPGSLFGRGARIREETAEGFFIRNYTPLFLYGRQTVNSLHSPNALSTAMEPL